MTVQGLIECLSKFPQNKEVVIDDADEGNELELRDVKESSTAIILSGSYNYRIRDRK